jgi:hypothetical protein
VEPKPAAERDVVFFANHVPFCIRYPRRSNVNTGFSVYISWEHVYTTVHLSPALLLPNPSLFMNILLCIGFIAGHRHGG